ncbi:hypothetical protein ARMSODRAFT_978109 [Armillaria solidipes]|uniref:Uncharacterized protein n=1 Tax=Armillaria solidipes TaxID=1076256 RepID=A0A2H3B409_9AGAR|nr:hypothetical protein ARMSODRAFT_978109 [Armillaria solidipes]
MKFIVMEDSAASRTLNSIVQTYYRGSREAIARLLYEQNIVLRQENTGTSVYVNKKDDTALRGTLLGQLHFGMCLMGETVVIPSRSWIYDREGDKEFLMVYVDPNIVTVNAPNNWFVDAYGAGPSQLGTITTAAILDESADFPVRLEVSLKKHTSGDGQCEYMKRVVQGCAGGRHSPALSIECNTRYLPEQSDVQNSERHTITYIRTHSMYDDGTQGPVVVKAKGRNEINGRFLHILPTSPLEYPNVSQTLERSHALWTLDPATPIRSGTVLIKC